MCVCLCECTCIQYCIQFLKKKFKDMPTKETIFFLVFTPKIPIKTKHYGQFRFTSLGFTGFAAKEFFEPFIKVTSVCFPD